MAEQQNPADDRVQTAPNASEKQKAASAEEAKVWEILEEARQKVKPIVKKEKEAEVLTGELLNLRLKAN
jgi:hypothetical protein